MTGNTVTNTNGQGVLFKRHFGGLNLVSNVVRSTGHGDTALSTVGGATTIASNDVVNVRDYPNGVRVSYPYYDGDLNPERGGFG